MSKNTMIKGKNSSFAPYSYMYWCIFKTTYIMHKNQANFIKDLCILLNATIELTDYFYMSAPFFRIYTPFATCVISSLIVNLSISSSVYFNWTYFKSDIEIMIVTIMRSWFSGNSSVKKFSNKFNLSINIIWKYKFYSAYF